MDADELEYAAVNGTAWCPTCQRRVAIADEYQTDTGDQYPQIHAYVARPLYCGHDDSTPAQITGRASDDTQTAEAMVGAATQARLGRAAALQDDA